MSPKNTFENINDLLKASLWPLIVITVIFLYKSDVDSIIRLIPTEIKNSSKISMGNFSIEIKETATEKGTPEIAAILTNLSEDGIKQLLELNDRNKGIVPYANNKEYFMLDEDIEACIELEKNNLLIITTPEDVPGRKDKIKTLTDFVNYFKSLNPKEEIRYRSREGTYSSQVSSAYSKKIIIYKLYSSQISQEEENAIIRANVKLSEKGRNAFDIIIGVVASQLSK